MNSPKVLLTSLTSIRFIAAFLIVLYHMGDIFFEAFPFLSFGKKIIQHGYLGVDFFFMLSGFVIWYNYGEKFGVHLKLRELKKFLLKRFIRLWPLHILGLILAVGIMSESINYFNNFGASVPTWFNIQGFAITASMMQVFVSPEPLYIWNQPAWAVSAEFIIYFLFPFICLILYRILQRINFVFVTALIILLFLFESINTQSGGFNGPYGWYFRFVLIFISGNLLAVLYSKIINKVKIIRILAVLQYLVPILIIAIIYLDINFNISALIALWILSISIEKTKLNKVLANKYLVALGSMSYAIYIMHWVIMSFMRFAIIIWPGLYNNYLGLTIALTIICVIGVSYAMWRYIENPSATYLKKLLKL